MTWSIKERNVIEFQRFELLTMFRVEMINLEEKWPFSILDRKLSSDFSFLLLYQLMRLLWLQINRVIRTMDGIKLHLFHYYYRLTSENGDDNPQIAKIIPLHYSAFRFGIMSKSVFTLYVELNQITMPVRNEEKKEKRIQLNRKETPKKKISMQWIMTQSQSNVIHAHKRIVWACIHN